MTIITHLEYDENGLVDELLTYEEVDISFVEQEDREIEQLIKGGEAQ